ncbi:hypothetical protein [Rhodoglobus sp.]
MKDLQPREQWFKDQRLSVELVCSSTPLPESLLPVSLLTEEVLSVGYRVGLLSVSDAVRITLQRFEDGMTLTPREERIAFSFREEEREIGVELLSVSLRAFPEAARVCRFLTVSLYRAAWDELDDPQESLQSFLITWQDGTAEFGEYCSPEPRLSDLVHFDRTQRRALASLGRALDFEKSELLQPQKETS